MLRLKGLEGVLKKSQVKIVVLFSKNVWARTGRSIARNSIRLEPAFTGCHIKD
jgi:hypothetical protein